MLINKKTWGSLFFFLSLNLQSIPAHAQTLANGLVAHVNFNSDNFGASSQVDAGGSYIPFQDLSGQGNPATCYREVIVSGVTHQMNQCPQETTGPDGSRAAEFYGTLCDVQSDHLGIANAPELNNLRTGSLALWVLYHQFAEDGVTASYKNTRLINTFNLSGPGTWYLGRDGTTNTLFKAMSSAGLERRIFFFPDTNTYSGEYETWNHMAVTWDGTSIKGYYNGTLFSTVSQDKFTTFNLGTYITIGALNHSDLRNSYDANCINQYGGDPAKTYVQPNTGFLNGKMDDIRIYNRALSSTEVSTLATAPLKRPTVQLRVIKSGTGNGTITSSSRGIGCGAACAEAYPPGTKITLSAAPRIDSVFAGWTGACTGTTTCAVTLNQNVDVGAVFTSTLETLAEFQAESARITTPFRVIDGVVIQPGNITGTPETGGRLEYTFTLAEASNVLVLGTVSAPDSGSDSAFINFDTLPTDPTMIWDVSSTVGFEERIVRWRGSGDNNNPEFNPKWFSLPAGQHKLIVVAREAGLQIDKIKIARRPITAGAPNAPKSLRVAG